MAVPDHAPQIRSRLIQAFAPSELEITDDSHLHVGHVGAQQGGGHYTIIIAADVLNDKKLLEAHRLIYDALGDLMSKEIHALRIKVKK